MHETCKNVYIAAVAELQMTGTLAKWAAALDTFDGIKHQFQTPGQVEKALNSIPLDERVLLFRGSDSDIIERLSAYDKAQGKLCLARAFLCLPCCACAQQLCKAF